MEYRRLGRCGMQVSVFGLGGWCTYGESVRDQDAVRTIMVDAFDGGVNFFDTADIYATGDAERMMGRVLREFPRHRLVVSTKVFWPMSDDVNDRGLSRKHIMESIDRSLKRLGLDYVDIYFCHRHDPETPLGETVRAMDDLVHQGKILYWGTSEWTGEQLEAAHGFALRANLYPPQVEQPQYSLIERRKFENDVEPAASELGMGLVTWSPLASGLLTGKYNDAIAADTRLARIDWLRDLLYEDSNLARVRELTTMAQKLNCTPAQLALAWTVRQPGVSSVITGATRPQQLQENLGALKLTLNAKTLKRLGKLFAY